MRNVIGIDLGTTYSAVARVVPQSGGKTIKAEIIKNGDGRSITPSVIQFLPDGDIVFGNEAKEAAEFGEDGCAQTFKRSMGSSDVYCAFYGKTYTAEDLSALLLTHLKEEAERSLGGKIDSAVVTVPAYFRDAERRSTMNAAKRAGLNVLCLLDEPVAAAINYGMGHWRDNAVIMVYDLGGGTFDVTIVKMENGHLETMYTAGNHVLGGKDWDNALVDIVCRKYYEETGERIDEDIAIRHAIGTEIEETKKALSMTNSHRTVVDLPGIGSYSCQITRAEFESETLPLLNNTTALCNQLLRDAGLNWKNITDILLVGGSTRMPQVKQCLKSISGLTPLEGIVNPDEAVALGAAIRAHALDQAGELAYVRPDAKKEGSKYVEVCLPKGRVGQETFGDELMVASPTVRLSHALGVVAVNEAGSAYTNQVIIPTNSRVPCSTARKFKFYTSPKGPNTLEIYMLEGDGELFSGECQFLAKYEVEGIKHVRGGVDIRIQYSKDPSSITHVQVRQGNEDVDLPIREVPLDDTSRFMQPPEVTEAKTESVTIVMAVDVSGSMYARDDGNDQTAIDNAKNAMCDFVEKYRDTDVEIGAMVVSDSTRWFCKPTSDYHKCINAIRSIECCCTGACNAAHPFDDIYNELHFRDGIKYGIVLADGVWNRQDVAINQAKRCHRDGIDIIGMGFGTADKAFMKAISSAGEIMIDASSGLSASFGSIAQTIGSGGSSQAGKRGDEGITDTWDVK